jgi:phage anti-repressor protein
MNELVKVSKSNIGEHEVNSINAKELHAFLEVKSKFNDWITARITKYNFIKNEDYITLSEISDKLDGGRPSPDYILSLDMAKELSMVENNDKGRKIRKYFIRIEEQYKEEQKLLNQPINQLLPAEIEQRNIKALKSSIDITADLFMLDTTNKLLFAQNEFYKHNLSVPHIPLLTIKSENEILYFKTQIYEKFNCQKGNPELKKQINAILTEYETSSEYASKVPYEKNGHTGTTFKYNIIMIKLIEKQLNIKQGV